jgi:hypothetical protein
MDWSETSGDRDASIYFYLNTKELTTMSNTRLTLRTVREVLDRDHSNIQFTNKNGEYRVTYKLAALAIVNPSDNRSKLIEKAEDIAAYETDIQAAFDTAIHMSAAFAQWMAFEMNAAAWQSQLELITSSGRSVHPPAGKQ